VPRTTYSHTCQECGTEYFLVDTAEGLISGIAEAMEIEPEIK